MSQAEMRSPMLVRMGMDSANYSPLKVMKSAAGYYVGTSHTDPTYGFEEPGSRDSGYFGTSAEAQAWLDDLVASIAEERFEDIPDDLRMEP